MSARASATDLQSLVEPSHQAVMPSERSEPRDLFVMLVNEAHTRRLLAGEHAQPIDGVGPHARENRITEPCMPAGTLALQGAVMHIRPVPASKPCSQNFVPTPKFCKQFTGHRTGQSCRANAASRGISLPATPVSKARAFPCDRYSVP